jgi:peptidoglycan hydrolase-like protein with peptidoglycan-binding domain
MRWSSINSKMEKAMKKLLLTSVAVLSVIAAVPASAQQSNSAQQRPSASSSTQQKSNAAASSVDQDEIMRAQQALNQKGFAAGKADGIRGLRTERALSRFQKSQGLQPSGRLNDQTLAALGLSKVQQQDTGQHSTTGQGGDATGDHPMHPPSATGGQNRLPSNSSLQNSQGGQSH